MLSQGMPRGQSARPARSAAPASATPTSPSGSGSGSPPRLVPRTSRRVRPQMAGSQSFTRSTSRTSAAPHSHSTSSTSKHHHDSSSSKHVRRRRDLRPLDTSNLDKYYARRPGPSRRPVAMYPNSANPSVTATANGDPKADPVWEDLDWAIGQMLLMGWDGTEVTPQIRSLIEDHHLGSIILTAKNLKSAHEMALLVQELQTIAHNAGHPQPLLIALDQENGGVNSLFDEDYVSQFPSAMGIAATGRAEMAYEVNKATAAAVGACGVNMMLGPVLDVLSNARYQPLGVRATGDDPQEVSQYGIAAMRGIKDAGLATCGKHFPSYGNLDFLGSSLDIPIITQTLEELSLSALVPFRNAIATGKLDGMFVGGCGISNPSMNVAHACLSEQVVDELLRNDLGFDGVAISECLEMQALSHDIGVQNGVVMAVEAGCDLVLLCRCYDVQLEAIKGLKLGIDNGIINRKRIQKSLNRMIRLKSTCTSWQQALNPPGISLLTKLRPSHVSLSHQAYNDSITVIRDRDQQLPLTKSMHKDEELLLLTPLVKPLPASSLTKSLLQAKEAQNSAPTQHDQWAHRDRSSIMSGEGVFREFGRSLARARHGKLLHTSYTANGVRPVHENLIHRASTIIIVTADANRNLYQSGFTKHVEMMCAMLRTRGQKKNVIVVAVSSPYDFALDKTIGTYICTFDFTENAMHALVRALCGEFVPNGSLPGTLRKTKKALKAHRHWIVEEYDRDRDATSLQELIQTMARANTTNPGNLDSATAASFELLNPRIDEAHFVVRNSSTNALFGFAATYAIGRTGILGAILVDPTKRDASIGRSLHRRALRHLITKRSIKKLQLGTCFPGVYLGVPVDEGSTSTWFANNGWDVQFPKRLTDLAINDLSTWAVPEGLLQSIQRGGLSFDLIHGLDNADAERVLSHVERHGNPETVELYRAAFQEGKACGIVRAKRSDNDALLGTVVICSPGSPLATYVPAIASREGDVGGVVAPVVAPSPQSVLVLQGLVLMGTRQNKAHKSTKTVLSWVQDEEYEHVLAMGFEVLQCFEEITNTPEAWADLA